MAGLDLPLVWAAIIVVGVVMYVLLDGFDLGVGILFPFLPTDPDRDLAMNSVAPIWDGNETWLVLGGGGLFAVFHLAYAMLMPALYVPILLMLTAGQLPQGTGGTVSRRQWTDAASLGDRGTDRGRRT